ncbi:DUF2147 domain-containing protein [Flavobacterium psychrophilum]|uniref:DUF2147 domain-containing protein n=1 Tax=Flavobacterium psychrophilum TaxID=96345 RepID=A0A1Z5HM27_FLAPS|nr:DUF2147 domain-containing protein [Flavobacterium psychrophilum]AIN74379.1 signal peptide protein [Flavobacterium psychrophilum FPG3]EKT2070001.1 DUF2147 domain-containing protein [Flavobacterium psychrophilum]EKT2072159.1 DUF2147 domain-containing protein [Flavobacterium psychrophilum]EKT3956254.1 DUF2147 domain-containing protein [Flavobacterium psychrophilum]EKT3964246.1 DUF2147 domain-containing protein [Flavobacterium psychrophilum]
MMIKKMTLLLLLIGSFQMQSQTVFGKWKTIDDKTGQAKSIVEVYENSGKVYGEVIEIIDPSRRNRKCEKCEGLDKNKPVLGLVIIKGLKKEDDEYNGGKILDPETGNIYKCFIKLAGKDKLEVRGYMGFSLIGRSQTWVRVK